MNTIAKRIESQVQFWTLLGPFLFLASGAVLLFKMSNHWYFPVSALIGIPLCVKWKMKGMAAALTCLLTLSILAYRSVDLDEQYWQVGMALAMAFSLIVLTLSLEEVEGLMKKMLLESQSRLDNFLHLEETLKASELSWEKERTLLQTQITALTQDSAKVLDDKQTFYKLAQLAKEELILLHTNHQHLLEELIYKNQHIADLKEKLEDTEITLQELINNDANQKVKHLTEQLNVLSNDITEREHEKEKLHVAIVRAQDQCQNLHEIETRQKKLIQEQLDKLNELKEILIVKENENQFVRQQNEELKQRLLSDETKYQEEKQAQLYFINDKLKHLENENEALQCCKEALEANLIEAKQSQQTTIERLQKELVEAKETLNIAQSEKKALLDQLQFAETKLNHQLENQSRLPSQEGNTRHIEAMYIQLKKQFEEKNHVLETTRQELFFANEKLETLQRHQEESDLFSISENESYLLHDIKRLTQELEALERDSKEEIEELYRIVSSLL